MYYFGQTHIAHAKISYSVLSIIFVTVCSISPWPYLYIAPINVRREGGRAMRAYLRADVVFNRREFARTRRGSF